MKIVESQHEAYAHVDHWRRAGMRIGLVPTMGALHAGHISLVERSREECEVSVATIFVNPAQFAPNEDLERYPKTLEEDLVALRAAGVDLVFVPRKDDLYPAEFSTYVHPPAEAAGLEGEYRPGHFRGVLTIVLKLFQLIPATVAYFGRKDYQQLVTVRRMVEDFNVPIRVVDCDTVREKDGLALSSRNRYLTAHERDCAVGLWQALAHAETLLAEGVNDVARLEAAMLEVLGKHQIHQVDYARVVDSQTLESLNCVDRPAVALIAAHLGDTRLIDNLLLEA